MRTTIVEGVMELADAGKDDLLIVFAHRDAQHFAFETVTAGLPCARLFVRDPSLRGWYNSGLPRVGHTVAEIAAFIQTKVNIQRYRRVVTLGSSMGGYAALLFGALLGVDRVLAFNPQTSLNRVFPISPPPEFAITYPDLASAIGQSQNTRFDLVIGNDDAADLCHAAHLVGQPGVRVWTVLGSSHLLTEELNRRGELAPLLNQWFRNDPMEILQAVPAAVTQGKAETIEHGVLAYLSGQYEAALALLAAAAEDLPDHPGLALFVGFAAAAEGQNETAVAALRTALRFRPQWDHAQEQLRLCLSKRSILPGDTLPYSVPQEGSFEGIGSSLDAAVLDALTFIRPNTGTSETLAEVVAWGIRASGVIGAHTFWARIKGS